MELETHNVIVYQFDCHDVAWVGKGLAFLVYAIDLKDARICLTAFQDPASVNNSLVLARNILFELSALFESGDKRSPDLYVP